MPDSTKENLREEIVLYRVYEGTKKYYLTQDYIDILLYGIYKGTGINSEDNNTFALFRSKTD